MSKRRLLTATVTAVSCLWLPLSANGASDSERDALQAIFAATGGDFLNPPEYPTSTWGPTVTASWDDEVACNYQGVICADDEGMAVIRLELHGVGLTGALPADIQDLTSLQRLDLSGNELDGPIPPELANLVIETESLDELDLSFNKLFLAEPADPDLVEVLNSLQPDWASTQTVPPRNVTVADGVVSWTPIAYTGNEGRYEILAGSASGGPYDEDPVAHTDSKTESSVAVPGNGFFVVRTVTELHDDNPRELVSANSEEAVLLCSAGLEPARLSGFTALLLGAFVEDPEPGEESAPGDINGALNLCVDPESQCYFATGADGLTTDLVLRIGEENGALVVETVSAAACGVEASGNTTSDFRAEFFQADPEDIPEGTEIPEQGSANCVRETLRHKDGETRDYCLVDEMGEIVLVTRKSNEDMFMMFDSPIVPAGPNNGNCDAIKVPGVEMSIDGARQQVDLFLPAMDGCMVPLTVGGETVVVLGTGGVNLPPTADPNGPYNGNVGQPVAFDGSGSSDPEGSVASYEWNFGDVNGDTGVGPMHTYPTGGIFTVTLTVTDEGGLSHTATTTATISAGDPDADGDGVPNNEDECQDSDLTLTVIIDGCDSGVPNNLSEEGCTISDEIQEIAASATNHGSFVRGVSHLTNELKKLGIITGSQKGAIQSCAAGANIP